MHHPITGFPAVEPILHRQRQTGGECIAHGVLHIFPLCRVDRIQPAMPCVGQRNLARKFKPALRFDQPSVARCDPDDGCGRHGKTAQARFAGFDDIQYAHLRRDIMHERHNADRLAASAEMRLEMHIDVA